MILYYVKLYGIMFVTFLAVDTVWLGLIARRFYAKHLGFLMADKPLWSVAMLFYLLFIAGVLVFVVLPGLQAGSARRVLLLGGLFGLVAYGTYDLTNLAVVKNWPWIVSVVDMCWGSSLGAIVGYVGFLAGRLLN